MPTAAGIYYFTHNQDALAPYPMVLIHGAGGHHLYWPPEIRRLKGLRVMAPDLPGHGKSAGPGEQTIQGYSAAFHDWLDNLGIQKAIVVGHSMGGAIALSYAHQHPQRIAGLGLISTGARLRVDPALMAAASRTHTLASAVDKIIKSSFSQTADSHLIELATRRFLETRSSVLHGDLQACDAFNLREQIPSIAVPALVLCGDQDLMTPLRFSQHLVRNLPNASLTVIHGAGHMVILERPRAVAGRLLAFVKQLGKEGTDT